MTGPEILHEKVQEVTKCLQSKKLTIGTAESCTGGWLAQVLTSRSGSSAWFKSGFVTYSNESKQELLKVPSRYFNTDGPGAVSEEVVKAMAAGTITACKANIAIAISGIAGPEGGTPEKPKGTVWIAWQWENRVQTRRFLFAGDRSQVRLAAVEGSLSGILEFIC